MYPFRTTNSEALTSILRLIQIRRSGETTRLVLFCVLAFITSTATAIGYQISDAMFLLHRGADELPLSYAVSGTVSLACAGVLFVGYHRFSSFRMFIWLHASNTIYYACATFWLSRTHTVESAVPWFVLKAGGFLSYMALFTSFWNLVDRYHHLGDAKRLFGVYGACIFLGLAASGSLLHSSLLSSVQLLAGVTLLFLTALSLAVVIPRAVPTLFNEREVESNRAHTVLSFGRFLRAVASSRLAILLLASDFLTQTLWWITEFNYLSAFDAHFAGTAVAIGDEASAPLTHFLGRCVATVGTFNILAGLFLYKRLVNRFGVHTLALISPTVLLITFLGWPLSTTLVFPLLGYFVIEGLNYSIDDNNFNLFLGALPPRIRYKYRVLVEWLFVPIGMLIVAPALYLIGESTRWVGLGLALVGLAVALGIRGCYQTTLLQGLADSALHIQRRLSDWLAAAPYRERQRSIEHLRRVAVDGDDEAREASCNALVDHLVSAGQTHRKLWDDNTTAALLAGLDTLDHATRLSILDRVSGSPLARHTMTVDSLMGWFEKGATPRERGELLIFLAAQGAIAGTQIRLYLNSEVAEMRGAAVLGILKGVTVNDPSDDDVIAQNALDALLTSDSLHTVCVGIRVLGLSGAPPHVDRLAGFLSHPDSRIVVEACRGFERSSAALEGSTGNGTTAINWRRYSDLLCRLIATSREPVVHTHCLKALGNIGRSSSVMAILSTCQSFRPELRRLSEMVLVKMGPRTVPTVLRVAKDRSLPPRSRIVACRVLAKVAPPQLRAHRHELISGEIEQAYFYLYHAHRVTSQHPEYDLSVLKHALLTGYQATVDFILQFLGVCGDLEDSKLLVRGLRSLSPKSRSHALESVQRTCAPEIFQRLKPLIDDSSLEYKLQTYLELGLLPLTLASLLTHMEDSPSQIDRFVAVTIRKRYGIGAWRDGLMKQLKYKDPITQRFSYELIAS